MICSLTTAYIEARNGCNTWFKIVSWFKHCVSFSK